ncbi:MAG: hypothetical protein A3B68_03135 [Candidatus Melainabacteria bacterium RIFCSPHIGHO2_02_FULL_34_12]|nr:MAG: hypothetical protein A3B68_03135 [Candidatus Melainabacteria bacterium RIFCSPHIGHO2_02_FULL_34_12]
MSATTVISASSPAANSNLACLAFLGHQAEHPAGFCSEIDFHALDYGPGVQKPIGRYIQIPGRWFQNTTSLIVLPKTGNAICIRIAKQHPNDKGTRRTALNDVKGPVLITVYAQGVESNEISLKQDIWVAVNRSVTIDGVIGSIRTRTEQQNVQTIQSNSEAISGIVNAVEALYPLADKSMLLQSVDQIVSVPIPA